MRKPAAETKRPILAQASTSSRRGLSLRLSGAQWAAIGILALTGVAAFGISPGTTLDTVPIRTIETPLPLPRIAATAKDSAPFWREVRVQRGDTIGILLARSGVDDASAMSFLRTDLRARALYQLKPGQAIRVATDEAGRLEALRFVTATGDLLSIQRVNDAFFASYEPAKAAVRLTMTSGVIQSSLFAAADAVDLPDAITMALAELFAGDIDFLQDLRRGDRFSVLYETRYVEGEPVGVGRVVAAEFENRGLRMSAYLWKDADGTDAWYTLDGRSTRKAFLRSPMEFSRVTSGFSFARFHPILRTWRAHRGIDYAAPVGTPVRATGDGVVVSAGYQGGYGNAIFLRHHGSYSTVYAHLSRFASHVRPGTRVQQGDTIGYVGATGWATGPHLHYEFRVNEEARNPATIALPTAAPLALDSFAAFLNHIEPLAHQLALEREHATPRVAAVR
jgi:murein DD-endopeptidase MepM/ murein hydrolase activator NlpD